MLERIFNKIMPQIINIILLMSLILSSNSFSSECLKVTSDKGITVELNYEGNKSKLVEAIDAFDLYMEYAKKNDVNSIKSSYSKLDGSYSFIDKKLNEIPDKFSDYKNIIDTNIIGGYYWGNYVILPVHYTHVNGEIMLYQAVLCTNTCQLSNVFERLDSTSRLVSTLISFHGIISEPPINCSKSKRNKSILIEPIVSFNSLNPIIIHLDKDVFKINFDNKEEVEMLDEYKSCYTNMKKIDRYRKGEEHTFNEFITNCTNGFTRNDLIPVLKIGKKPTKLLVDLMSLLQLFQNPSKIRFVNKDGNITLIGVVISVEKLGEVFVLLPLILKDKKHLIDFEYYSTIASKLIISPHFFKFTIK